MEPRIISEETVAKGKWLELKSLLYEGPSGKEHKWECVNRRVSGGAAALVAMLRPSGRLLLIRQFRPPAGGHVIEFPAGLVDQGESAESTAVRELLEETGYHGSVSGISPRALSSPGLSSEHVNIVFMEVDETSAENSNPCTRFDDNEHIETFAVKLDELQSFLEHRRLSGDLMDAKVIAFASFQRACGMQQQP